MGLFSRILGSPAPPSAEKPEVDDPDIKDLPTRPHPRQHQIKSWTKLALKLEQDGAPPDKVKAARSRAADALAALEERNVKGGELEKIGSENKAIRLYEANVADEFDGTHPYERLMIIYSRRENHRDAQRVAEACLQNITGELPERVKDYCDKILGRQKDA